ncbi:MAG: diaminopimelate decarboxylase [Candidatus Omnitrophota bacterium]
MHEFRYRRNALYCEDAKVSDLALRFGTPLFVYSYHTLIDHFVKLQKAFASIKPLICYSVKANSNLAILKALIDKGAGLDVVSGGELFRAGKAGCPAQRIVYASVGKTESEIEEAVRRGILFFNVESIPELNAINRIAKKLRKITAAAIRVNPDIEPKTHAYITTGKNTNKFGIDFASVESLFRKAHTLSHVAIKGLHIHIGSQITESTPFVSAISKILCLIRRLKASGVHLEYLNIGGGLGIVYDKETPQTASAFALKVLPLIKESGLKIILEPGRFIVGNAGILVTKILYVKETRRKTFLIVDAGMNDLIRPALYSAYHRVIPLKPKKRHPHTKGVTADVVGPICESGDFLAKDRKLPPLLQGEYLAVMGAGAYGFSMSSNYNSRRRAQEVMIVKDRAFVIRKRESFQDLVKNENIPPFLLGL